MITFKYSLLSKIIFRYANFPATLFLLLYLVSSFIYMFTEWYYIFPVLLNLLIIIMMNKFYLHSYKVFPFKIAINNERMICSDFFNKSKVHEIKLSEIDSIEGGTLSGNPAKPIYIYIKKDNLVIGISPHIKNQNKLITIILSNVRQEVYNGVLTIAKELHDAEKVLHAKGRKGKKKPIKK